MKKMSTFNIQLCLKQNCLKNINDKNKKKKEMYKYHYFFLKKKILARSHSMLPSPKNKLLPLGLCKKENLTKLN